MPEPFHPEQREEEIQRLAELRWAGTTHEEIFDKMIVPLLTTARREGAEQGWDEGNAAATWAERAQAEWRSRPDGDPHEPLPQAPRNPYRADKIAKGAREKAKR